MKRKRKEKENHIIKEIHPLFNEMLILHHHWKIKSKITTPCFLGIV